MTSPFERRYGDAFDEIAGDYDRARPGYPAELVDRACRAAGVVSGDRVLELRCGSGQLTRSLVSRGLRVTAVQPGERLLALAERNLAGAGEVAFVRERFEDADLPGERFRAVFSAAAFHWIDPEVSWRESARVLEPHGTLALLQYCGLREERSRHDQDALLAALARHAPEIAAGWPVYRTLAETVAGAEQRRANVSAVWAWVGGHDLVRTEAHSLFGPAQVTARPLLVEQSGDELNALLRTASFYRRLSAGQRRALEEESVALHRQLGRPIRSSMVAVLVTARRRAPARGSAPVSG